MLKIHVLNVGQGDSILVHFSHDGGDAFGLIDCFMPQRINQPKALQKLIELGADRLAFVCLTHPHKDHYRGLYNVLAHYRGKIDDFYIFPAQEYIGKKRAVLARQYVQLAEQQDDPDIAKDALEFVRILKFLDEELDAEQVHELAGPRNSVPVVGFPGVSVEALTPFRHFKGAYLQRIRNNDPDIFESEAENRLSISLLLRYAGVNIVLGGDADKENWAVHKRYRSSGRTDPILAHAVKLPHHGSKRDCTSDTLSVLYDSNTTTQLLAFISANGVKHPDGETLDLLEKMSINPYCTNLHPRCGANVSQIVRTDGVDPVLAKYLNELSNNQHVQPCQGDIEISVNKVGQINVSVEHQVPCGFRGAFDTLGL